MCLLQVCSRVFQNGFEQIFFLLRHPDISLQHRPRMGLLQLHATVTVDDHFRAAVNQKFTSAKGGV